MHLTFLIPYFALGLGSVVFGAPHNTFSNGLDARHAASKPKTVITITLPGPYPADAKEASWVEDGVEQLLNKAGIINQEDVSSHSGSGSDDPLLPGEKLVWEYKPKGPAIVVSQFTFTFTGSAKCGASACSGEVWQSCLHGACIFTKGTVKDGSNKEIYPK